MTNGEAWQFVTFSLPVTRYLIKYKWCPIFGNCMLMAISTGKDFPD